MRKLILLFSILMCSLLHAQKVTVKGTVKEAIFDEPIPGATILILNTTKGTQADFDGNYSIDTNMGDVLVFSSLGYVSKNVTVDGSTINVTLQDSTEQLDEIVVVGYGTQKITKVSGAISTVKAETLENLKPARVEEALQGTASGVSVVQGGSPGSKPTVLVRGIPSYSGVDPVVIIDGVPQTLDDLNAINSNDIQSLNVLKDAASTAIYGVKGGNGVIVVTTKSGRNNGKVEFNVNSYTGIQSVLNQVGVLNATEYGAIMNEGSLVSGGGLIFNDISSLGKGTNWQDEIFKDALVTSNNFSARGGSEKMSYFLSTGYLNQGGIVGGSDKSNFKRFNATANLNFQLSPKWKFILNTTYANIKRRTVAENSFNSILGNALNFDPTVEVYNNDVNDFAEYGYSDIILSEIFNPVQRLDNTYNENNGNKLYGKFEVQYDVLKNLKLTSRFGYVKWNEVGKEFNPLAYYGPNNVSSDYNADGTVKEGQENSVTEYNNSSFDYTIETFVNYNFDINDKHNFDVVVGTSVSKETEKKFEITAQGVRDNSWDWASVEASTDLVVEGLIDDVLERRNLSYFGRINYDFEEKYLASFSARRDGSIAFGDNNKFGNFYAGSLGWVLSKEDFFNNEKINFLKLRGSYGTVGNENVDPQFVSVVTGGASYGATANSNGYTFNGVFNSGSTINSFNNTTLAWEEQTQYNIGFDLKAFNNISLTVDYFNKSVDGLLFEDITPLIAGTSLPVDSNIGSTESKGFDINLGYQTSSSKDFKFNTNITFTTSKNLVTETNSDGTASIPGGAFFNGLSQDVTRFEKGFTPAYFYGLKTDGLFQNQAEIDAHATQAGAQPGDIRYVDVDGDGTITDLDRTEIGDPFPEFTLGWNVGFKYKNFDLSMFTYASVGNDVFRAYERNRQDTNRFRGVLDRWTGEGSTNDADNPRYTFLDTNSNLRVSDRYVEDGSFVKIKSLILGYSVPGLENTAFSKIRFYAQAKNLHTFTDYSGYDPEIAGTTTDSGGSALLETGIDRGAYPQARTFLIGLDLKF